MAKAINSSPGGNEGSRKVYWVIIDNAVSPYLQYVTCTNSSVTYIQLESKFKVVTGRHEGASMTLNYKRATTGNIRLNKVIINSDETINLAVEYFGECAYDVRQGVVVCTDLTKY